MLDKDIDKNNLEASEADDSDAIEDINNEPVKEPDDYILDEFDAEDEVQTEEKTSLLSLLMDYTEIFVFSVCFVILFFSFVVRLCTVIGPSMNNTLVEDEKLLVSDVLYEPERYDVIVFHQTGYLNEPVVKRVIALGGETIDIDFDTWTVKITDKEGKTFILDEPYMYLDPDSPLLTSIQSYPYEVPEGMLFVMGDNRNHSSDSRGYAIGLVDERRILGKVILRITPISKFGTVE